MKSSRGFWSVFACVTYIASSTACVESSGIKEQPPDENVVSVDGKKAVPWKSVTIEIPKDGKEYVDGRRARVSVLVDQLTLFIQLGKFDHAPQTIVPFGDADISGTDGDGSKIAYEALSGTVTVVDGDGSPGSQLSLTLAGVDLVDECAGTHKAITSASISGTATDGDFTNTIGVSGFVFSDDVETSFYPKFPYVGPVGAQAFTNSHGVSFFQAGTAESCNIQNPRPNHHLFTVAIDPTEVPAGGGALDLAHVAQSFVFVTEAASDGTKVRQALATKGTVTLDGDITLTDGSVLSGTLTGLSYSYLDANLNFTSDPPMTVASMQVKAIFGKPVLP